MREAPPKSPSGVDAAAWRKGMNDAARQVAGWAGVNNCDLFATLLQAAAEETWGAWQRGAEAYRLLASDVQRPLTNAEKRVGEAGKSLILLSESLSAITEQPGKSLAGITTDDRALLAAQGLLRSVDVDLINSAHSLRERIEALRSLLAPIQASLVTAQEKAGRIFPQGGGPRAGGMKNVQFTQFLEQMRAACIELDGWLSFDRKSEDGGDLIKALSVLQEYLPPGVVKTGPGEFSRLERLWPASP
jgi:hypothetical protein